VLKKKSRNLVCSKAFGAITTTKSLQSGGGEKETALKALGNAHLPCLVSNALSKKELAGNRLSSRFCLLHWQ
jgi:hypothetical protein